jgi:hypothetical protein
VLRLSSLRTTQDQKVVDLQLHDAGLITRSRINAAPLAAKIACKVKGNGSNRRKLTSAREKFNGNMRRAFVKLRPTDQPVFIFN